MLSEGVCARENGRHRSVQRAKRDSREQRKIAEKESRKPHTFWNMVYGKNFRAPFSSIYKAIFQSNYKPFPWTSVLQRLKRPKMLKTFYGKRFTSKQTEPYYRFELELKWHMLQDKPNREQIYYLIKILGLLLGQPIKSRCWFFGLYICICLGQPNG